MAEVSPSAGAGLAEAWWLLAAVGVCLPVSAAVFWRLGRWWVSDRPLPLPLDRAYPRVPYPAWVGVAVFLVLQALAVAAAGLVGLGFPAEGASADDLARHAAQAAVQLVPLLGGLALVAAGGRAAAEATGLRGGDLKRGLALGVVAFAAVLPVCVAALVVSVAAMGLLRAPVEPHPLLVTVQETHRPGLVALVAVEAGLVAPVVEEFLYRGLLFWALVRGVGVLGAMIASSALFAVVHLPTEPQAVAPLFILGMALAYAAYRTRSLVAPTLAHALFNGLMVAGTRLGAGG